ncbi:hypothetical protein A5320_17515 [Rheinheimera sp. SA_1]|uniref:hypothetical protein n=1 Tax=Rheinheimera sp. SA_1 TaxID=1827365 RepID=UPI0007FD6D9D|nr:hypothetical protein [Rheinheimera sp. SA_1]OBP13718.1 hypothetical protein A5320_17515 [Rheinheimera sp. SA_1]
MPQIKPFLTIAQSSDALYVSFVGVHADELTARYAAELDFFCQQLAGKRWARIVDLRQWTVTAAPAQEQMVQLLKLDIARGLSLEYVLPPPEVIGNWQVAKTLAQLPAPEIFHRITDPKLALEGLAAAGFSTAFGAPRRFEINVLL